MSELVANLILYFLKGTLILSGITIIIMLIGFNLCLSEKNHN